MNDDSYTASDCLICYETTTHNRIFHKVNEISKVMYACAKEEIRTKTFDLGVKGVNQLDHESLEITKLSQFLEDKGFTFSFFISDKASDDGYYRWGVNVSF